MGVKGAGTGRGPNPLLIVLLLVLLLLGAAAYLLLRHRGSTSTIEPAANATAPVSNAGSATKATTLLRLSGSNTIGSQPGPDLAQAWLAARGATGIHRTNSGSDETDITGTQGGAPVFKIKAHGSATAFTDLAASASDLGMSSRKIKSEEAADLQSKGLGGFSPMRMNACSAWMVWPLSSTRRIPSTA